MKKTSNRKKSRPPEAQLKAASHSFKALLDDLQYGLPVFAMHLPFVEAIASYRGVAADQALRSVELALKSIGQLSEVNIEVVEFPDVIGARRGISEELESVDRRVRGLFTTKLESDSAARWIVFRLFDPNLPADATPSSALEAKVRGALTIPYDRAAARRDMLQTRWPVPEGGTPEDYGSHPKFSSRWWNLHQVLAWVAVRTRETVDMAGAAPGSHVFKAINNIDSPRMGAEKAQAGIRDALTNGQLVAFRLVNGKLFPAVIKEWTVTLFMLSGPDGPDEWWSYYRVLSEDVMKLWPQGSPSGIPRNAAGTAETAGKAVAPTPQNPSPKKNRKITGDARILAVCYALHEEGKDPRKMSVKELYLEVQAREGKSGARGLGIRNVERALAKWKPPPKPIK